MKYMKEFLQEFTKKTAFTIKDIRIFLNRKNISKNYSYVFVHNLLKSGRMKQINRGVYTFKEEIEIVGFAYSPFYYGLQEALSLRNLWEQETNPVVLTPKKIRNGRKTFLDRNYIVRRINRRMFFGFEMIRYYDFWIPVSDVEKTLIDLVYFREPISKEVLEEIKNGMRPNVLKEYLGKCPKYISKRVMRLLEK